MTSAPRIRAGDDARMDAPIERPPTRAAGLERVTEALERRTIPTSTAGDPRPRDRAVPTAVPTAVVVPRSAALAPPSPLREDIEAVLADGLAQAYAELPPTTQATFRARGEQLAQRLERMIASGALVVREAYRGLTAWLSLLPSRGTFFAYYLTQEAKVKMDAILALSRRSRG